MITKFLCTLLLCVLYGVNVKSQIYLLYQGNNEALYLSDLTSNKLTTLSKDAFGRLVGYEIKEDSLICYFEIRGKLKTQKFKNNLFSKIEVYPVSMQPNFEEKHIATQKYFFNEYEFNINYLELRLYKATVSPSVFWIAMLQLSPFNLDNTFNLSLAGFG